MKKEHNGDAPKDYELGNLFKGGSKKVFEDFFDDDTNKKYFPDVKGIDFYHKIRCGLLHQAQTKGKWRLVRTGKFWDADRMSINRDEFSERLRECFDGYLRQLDECAWDDPVWKSARKKIWWLTRTS